MISYLFRHEILSVNCGSFSLFILMSFFFSTFLIIILMSQQQKQQLNDCHQTVGASSTGETEEAVTHLTSFFISRPEMPLNMWLWHRLKARRLCCAIFPPFCSVNTVCFVSRHSVLESENRADECYEPVSRASPPSTRNFNNSAEQKQDLSHRIV